MVDGQTEFSSPAYIYYTALFSIQCNDIEYHPIQLLERRLR